MSLRSTLTIIGAYLGIAAVFLALKYSGVGAIVASALWVADYRIPATFATLLTFVMLWLVWGVLNSGQPPLTAGRSRVAAAGGFGYLVLFASVWHSTTDFFMLSGLEQLLLICMSVMAAFHVVLLIAGLCGLLVHAYIWRLQLRGEWSPELQVEPMRARTPGRQVQRADWGP